MLKVTLAQRLCAGNEKIDNTCCKSNGNQCSTEGTCFAKWPVLTSTYHVSVEHVALGEGAGNSIHE